MGVVSCRSRGWWRRLAAFAVVFFAVAIVVTAGRPIRVPAALLQRRRIDSPVSRRRLAGLGSSPPTCWARCGRCTPCRAVRVAIQPGVGTQWEYYPEVWRCKCGSKLFMP